MKTVELKNYVKSKLKEYLSANYEDTRVSKSNLINHSQDDQRLAELAQSYYLVFDKLETSKVFAEYTHQHFNSKEEFLKSDSKYVWQYNKLINKKDKLKQTFRQKMLDMLKDKDVSMYRVSKEGKVNQSNLSSFLKKGQLDKLSVKKVLELHSLLDSA